MIVDTEVAGIYCTLEEAKQKLFEYAEGVTYPSRLIAEVVDGLLNDNPKYIDGEPQVDGPDAGFNKYWKDAEDMERMNDIAKTAYEKEPTTCADEEEEGMDDAERIYYVVVEDEVVGRFCSVEEAKNRLRDVEGNDGEGPCRMVVEIVNGEVEDDPHWIDGEKQGDGIDAGFNKYWSNWEDIKKMTDAAREVFENDPETCLDVLEDDSPN